MLNETYAHASNILMAGVMTAYVAGMFLFAISFAQGRPNAAGEVGGRKAGNVALSLTTLGTALLGAAVVARGLSAGRVPWGNMYEFAMTGTFGVMSVMLFASYRLRARWLGLFVIVPALLILMVASVVFYTDSAQLMPALRSYWLVIHVFAAIVSAGAFTVGAVLTLLQLIAARAEQRAEAGLEPDRRDAIAARVPDADWLDAVAYRVHAFTFPLWTFTIVAGAIWARAAWSRYWGWDPKETWSFVTWVGYAAYLHARVTVGWSGRKASYIALSAYSAMLFNFTIVNLFFSGLHTYSGK